MHMADALLSTATAGTMYLASAGAAAVSIRKIKLENDAKKIPVMGVMGAFIFATQMLNFTIPGTGASGHLCGGMLASALLGPYAGFLTMVGVLLLQCLLFADGGILALGANIWNMAFYGCFIGALLIWRPIMRRGASRKKIITASILGCVLTLQMGAFSVVMETLLSGITELPFALFAGVMQPIHLAIGLVEGLITSAVLLFVYEARPQMLWGVGAAESRESRLSVKKILLVLAILALLFGAVVSHYASSNPDGLEWSLEKITGSTELEKSDSAHDQAQEVQEKTALFPDYSLTSEGEDSDEGKVSLTGIAGASVFVLLTACVGMLVKKEKNAKK